MLNFDKFSSTAGLYKYMSMWNTKIKIVQAIRNMIYSIGYYYFLVFKYGSKLIFTFDISLFFFCNFIIFINHVYLRIIYYHSITSRSLFNFHISVKSELFKYYLNRLRTFLLPILNCNMYYRENIKNYSFLHFLGLKKTI